MAVTLVLTVSQLNKGVNVILVKAAGIGVVITGGGV